MRFEPLLLGTALCALLSCSFAKALESSSACATVTHLITTTVKASNVIRQGSDTVSLLPTTTASPLSTSTTYLNSTTSTTGYPMITASGHVIIPDQSAYYFAFVNGTTSWLNDIAPPSTYYASITKTVYVTVNPVALSSYHTAAVLHTNVSPSILQSITSTIGVPVAAGPLIGPGPSGWNVSTSSVDSNQESSPSGTAAHRSTTITRTVILNTDQGQASAGNAISTSRLGTGLRKTPPVIFTGPEPASLVPVVSALSPSDTAPSKEMVPTAASDLQTSFWSHGWGHGSDGVHPPKPSRSNSVLDGPIGFTSGPIGSSKTRNSTSLPASTMTGSAVTLTSDGVTGAPSTATDTVSLPGTGPVMGLHNTTLLSTISQASLATLTKSFTNTTRSSTPLPSVCGEHGDFVLSWDDEPTFSPTDPITDPSEAPPVFNPYHHMYFSNGYVYIPPPRDPFPPISQPRLVMFLTNETGPSNNPNAGGEHIGEIGAGDRASESAFWFNAYSAYLGCDNEGPDDCTMEISGYVWQEEAQGEVLAFQQNATLPACPGYVDCKLQQVKFANSMVGLSGIQIRAVVNEQHRIWYMDDLALGWYNNTCAAGLLRIRSN